MTLDCDMHCISGSIVFYALLEFDILDKLLTMTIVSIFQNNRGTNERIYCKESPSSV